MIQTLKKWEQYGRRRLANAFWFLFGQRHYRRFVIIAHERTGSSMLVSCLNAHPQIECHGELFKKLDGRSISQIEHLYFGPKPGRVQAAGCKLFYSHPVDGDPSAVWDMLRSWKMPLIIHLTREDALRTLASLRIAEATEVWGLHVAKPEIPLEKRRVSLSPDEVRSFVSRLRQNEQRIEVLFQHGDYLHITYESLVRNPESILHTIFDRLGVDRRPVETPYKKINPEPLEELIINFHELKDQGLI